MLRKSLETILTLFLATLVIFLLTRLAPGDPARLMLGHQPEVALKSTVYEEKLEELRKEHGLDRSLFTQYVLWMKQLAVLDLGTSFHTGRPVSTELAERLPATLLLSGAALLLQGLLGMVLGSISARRAGGSMDQGIRALCILLASSPAFVIGLLLLFVFSIHFRIYEISSHSGLDRLWLPALTLGIMGAPQLIRVTRANMLAELGRTYVHSALSRGIGRKRVLRHASRNVRLPFVTMLALSFTSMVSGAVVIESIFSWPGIGKYALDSILVKDYPVIQGYTVVMVTIVILIHRLTDLFHVWADPRLSRRTRRRMGQYELDQQAG